MRSRGTSRPPSRRCSGPCSYGRTWPKPARPSASSTCGKAGSRKRRRPCAGAELKGHPSDLLAQQNLASVLDLQQRGDEAVVLLRAVVQSKPELSDARYLLGKILLAQGAAAEAVEQLKTAADIAPRDANIHYQLGKAYQKLGKADLAEQEFEAFPGAQGLEIGSVGSVTFRIWSAWTFVRVCVFPEGQESVNSRTTASVPGRSGRGDRRRSRSRRRCSPRRIGSRSSRRA